MSFISVTFTPLQTFSPGSSVRNHCRFGAQKTFIIIIINIENSCVAYNIFLKVQTFLGI